MLGPGGRPASGRRRPWSSRGTLRDPVGDRSAETGAESLERAFQGRLREVDDFEGFLRLQVWRDRGETGRFVMVGWWRYREDYVAYMRSASHRRSHDRIPTVPAAPYAVGAGQFDVVAE